MADKVSYQDIYNNIQGTDKKSSFFKTAGNSQEAQDAFKILSASSSSTVGTVTSTDAASSASTSAASSGVLESLAGGVIGIAEFANKAVKSIASIGTDLAKTQMGAGQSSDPIALKILEAVKDGGLNPAKLLQKVIAGGYQEILNQLTEESKLLTEVNQKTGISGELSAGLRDDMKNASIEAKRYGVGLQEIGQFYTEMVNNSGKFALINRQTIDQAVPVAAALGRTMSEMSTSINEFEKVGLGADKAIKELGDAATRTIALGMSARKVTTDMQASIGKLNEYGFKNGIQGLETMARKASEFRLSMDSVFKVADNVFDPEKAIDLSANLQVLGGAIGDFNDPLKLMYMATNNVEGLQDSIIGAAKSLAVYNQEQGRFEVTGINSRRAREMAKTLGIDYGELTKSAIAAQERISASTSLMSRGLQIDDKQKEFLTNISRMQGGEMKILIPESLQDKLGKQTEISLDKLTSQQAKVLLDNQKAFADMSPKDIAMSQLTATQQMSRGIDVIAQYYKIRGAELIRGAGKGALGKEYDKMKSAIDKFSIEKSSTGTSTLENDTEKNVRWARENPWEAIKKMGKSAWDKLVSSDSNNAPTSGGPNSTVLHKFEFGPTNSVWDSFHKEMVKDPTSVKGALQNGGNEFTDPKVAHRN